MDSPIALALRRRIAALAEIDNASEQPSDAEIDDLGKRLGVPVPIALRAYFGAMGRYRGTALMGTTTSFDKVESMTADARTTMRRWDRHLPEDAIVLMSHQGCDFTFVRANEGPDPTVLGWAEADEVRARYDSILALVEAIFPPV